MAKSFRRSSASTRAILDKVMEMYYPDLIEYKISIDLMDAFTSDGKPAVMHHGKPAYAVIKQVSLKDRAKGNGDVEITIDEYRFSQLSERSQMALLDHELHHLEFKLNKDDQRSVDDLGRFLFTMKPHDIEFGWFNTVAARWGSDSIESMQARDLNSDPDFQSLYLNPKH